MAAEISWQKSLRRSTGEQPIIKKRIQPTRDCRKRLGSIQECDGALETRKRLGSFQECDVFDENLHCKIKPGNPSRRRLSTKDSVSELNDLENRPKKTTLLQSPAKITKNTSFLKKLPPRLEIPKEVKVKNDIPSPIPLPPGVFSKIFRFIFT